MGARGHRLERADGLTELVKGCLERGGVHVVDVPVSYEGDNELLNERIPRRVTAAR